MMFIRLIKIEFIVNGHCWSDSQYYILLFMGTGMGKCFHMWDFIHLTWEICQSKTATLLLREKGVSCVLGLTKGKVSCCSSLQCVRFLELWEEAVFTAFAMLKMSFEVLVGLLFPSHALQMKKLNLLRLLSPAVCFKFCL